MVFDLALLCSSCLDFFAVRALLPTCVHCCSGRVLLCCVHCCAVCALLVADVYAWPSFAMLGGQCRVLRVLLCIACTGVHCVHNCALALSWPKTMPVKKTTGRAALPTDRERSRRSSTTDEKKAKDRGATMQVRSTKCEAATTAVPCSREGFLGGRLLWRLERLSTNESWSKDETEVRGLWG